MNDVAYQGQYFSILLDRDANEFVHTGDEALVVPLTTDDMVLLTIEPAPAFGGEVTLVLPGGETEANEPPSETANRELQEEIGYAAERLDFLGELRPFSKYLTVRSYVYLARDLVPSRMTGDEDYEVGIERVPLSSFETLIDAGRLHDARAIAALYLARCFLESESHRVGDER